MPVVFIAPYDAPPQIEFGVRGGSGGVIHTGIIKV
jgi:hypothetical protein